MEMFLFSAFCIFCWVLPQALKEISGVLSASASIRTLKQAAGEADRPSIHLVFFSGFRRDALRRAGALCLCIDAGRLKRQNDWRHHGE
jgi:hypothetical protein